MSTIVAVGLEAIGQGVGADARAAWQVQVGVTRVGGGGRVLPRCRNGRMATIEALVAATLEPQEIVRLPRAPRKTAPLARAIAFLAVAVVARVETACRRGVSALASLARAIWQVFVPSRDRSRVRALQAWHSAREMGILLPSV